MTWTHHRRLRGLGAGLAVASLVAGAFLTAPAYAAPLKPAKPAAPDFGPNVMIFSPSTPLAQIKSSLDALADQQRDAEMSSARKAVFFLPGTYGDATNPLNFEVGYYTEVEGLGASPTDVTINGSIDVYNRCLDNNQTSNCLALVNFWRTLGNLSIQVNKQGADGCRNSGNFWAVSQAVSMRRVQVTGANLTLMDYCSAGPQWASGGFIADSKLPYVVSGSQQQWLTRNSVVDGWSNGVWNQVFSGVTGAPDDAGYPNPPYTTLASTPLSREKPYLYVDDAGKYFVRVPAAKRDTSGVSWANGMTPGRSLPLSSFYIAKPTDSAKTINVALARGLNLLLTPGIYNLDRTIDVKRADTVVLGIGQATLTPTRGQVALQTADVPGVIIAGVTFDAGTKLSPALLRVGKAHPGRPWHHGRSSASNPTTLSDVYFRVGGPHVGRAVTSLEVNSDNVLIDHTWIWRADHGIEGFTGGDDERWATNIGLNGLVVNGDDVTATGLFSEHFQKYSVLWNGERGRTIFFQNELPYDPPTQADWTQPNGTLGYPAYKVATWVKKHSLAGGGVYVFNQNNPSIVTTSGYEVPDTKGVRLHHVITVNLSGPGTILHVVNDTGPTADSSNSGTMQVVVDYPQP